MEPTILEDTLPPENAQGIRRFTIQTGDHQIILQARQEAREHCPGEIHPTDGFAPCSQPVSNQQLVNAFLALTKVAVNAPRHASLS